MDDNTRVLKEILAELRKIREDVYNMAKYKREISIIESDVKEIKRILERNGWR